MFGASDCLKEMTSKVQHLEDMIADTTESKMECQEVLMNRSVEQEALETKVKEMKEENAQLSDQIDSLTSGNDNLARDIGIWQEKLESATKSLTNDLQESKESIQM